MVDSTKTTATKYMRVKESILRKIREGQLQPGERVDSISEIVAKYAVSKVTAVHALAALEAEGIVRREHGRGTFVTDRSDEAIRSLERRTVAIIVPDMDNPFNVDVVASIEKHLRTEGVVCELCSTDGQCAREQETLDRIRLENKASGVVLVSYATPGDFVARAVPNVPIVAIDYCRPAIASRSVFISCDNFKGGHDAARHLVSLGHKRIGCVRWGEVSESRIEGFRKGLEDSGLTLGADRVFFTRNHMELGGGFLEFIRKQQLTAIFATNDVLAMQVMRELRSAGYGIPEDISLIGYDNVASSQYLEVPLTTIEQYGEEIGHRAAASLLAAMDPGPAPFVPKEILIIPTLVLRNSTAPPKR